MFLFVEEEDCLIGHFVQQVLPCGTGKLKRVFNLFFGSCAFVALCVVGEQFSRHLSCRCHAQSRRSGTGAVCTRNIFSRAAQDSCVAQRTLCKFKPTVCPLKKKMFVVLAHHVFFALVIVGSSTFLSHNSPSLSAFYLIHGQQD